MKSTFKVSMPSDLEIVVEREFNAPRKLVWEAMTKPDLIRRWLYAPDGWQMTVCEGGMNVGDQFRWSWNGPDGKRALTISGVNREVVPLEKIVHTEAMEMGEGIHLGELLATVQLTDLGERTKLRLTMLFTSKQARDGALASGMERGIAAGYERLDELLQSSL